MTNEQRKIATTTARAQIEILKILLNTLKEECPHDDLDKCEYTDSVTCNICGARFKRK
jgi:hypothetical protein